MNYMSREFLETERDWFVSARFNNDDPGWPEIMLNICDGSNTVDLCNVCCKDHDIKQFMASLKIIRKHIDGLLEVMEANPVQENKDEN